MTTGVVNYNTWSNWARCLFVEYDAEWSFIPSLIVFRVDREKMRCAFSVC